MTYEIRDGTPDDVAAVIELFPRLAAFAVPATRAPEDLWRGDAELLHEWAAGRAPECRVSVAVGADGAILGAAMARLREELLSHAPSAHLEALVVRQGAEGRGIGAALIAAVERQVREQGALSMTLHVFASNTRARAVYERAGYSGELIRYIRHFE